MALLAHCDQKVVVPSVPHACKCLLPFLSVLTLLHRRASTLLHRRASTLLHRASSLFHRASTLHLYSTLFASQLYVILPRALLPFLYFNTSLRHICPANNLSLSYSSLIYASVHLPQASLTTSYSTSRLVLPSLNSHPSPAAPCPFSFPASYIVLLLSLPSHLSHNSVQPFPIVSTSPPLSPPLPWSYFFLPC